MADAALVVRAFAAERVPQATTEKAMRAIYPGDLQPYLPELATAAYADFREAEDYAVAFLNHCLANRGNVARFLGSAL